MEEGILKLKKDGGGYRHYIELPDGTHDDIHCSAALEVRLNDLGGRVPERWISGRYEADLCSDIPKARLIVGVFYGCFDDVEIVLPLGAVVRRPERG